MLDAWPNHTAIGDFGLDSQEHYEALYYPIRASEITPSALDDALGHGEKLTALVRAATSNPHKDIEFHTSWDAVLGRDEQKMKEAFERMLDNPAKEAPQNTPTNDRSRDR